MNIFKIIDISVDPLNFKPGLLKICDDIRPYWNQNSIKFIEFNGGLTNKLVGCYENDKNDLFLCRIYGNGTSSYINRTEELLYMKLYYENNIGSQVYAQFSNGICYEFIKGEISTQEMLQKEEIYTKVAQVLARAHQISTDNLPKQTNLFSKIKKFIDLIPNNSNLISNDLFNKLYLYSELNFIENYLLNYCNKHNSKLVLSHNDLLLANIIYNNQNKSISFIDFEYADFNYQAYDIANHFNEHAGVDSVDYSLFPSKEYQFKWIKCYLEAFNKNHNIDERIVEEFYDEVNLFCLASHLFWGTWSIVQAHSSINDFDFVNYAKIRLGEYERKKKELIK